MFSNCDCDHRKLHVELLLVQIYWTLAKILRVVTIFPGWYIIDTMVYSLTLVLSQCVGRSKDLTGVQINISQVDSWLSTLTTGRINNYGFLYAKLLLKHKGGEMSIIFYTNSSRIIVIIVCIANGSSIDTPPGCSQFLYYLL